MIQWVIIGCLVVVSIAYLLNKLIRHFTSSSCDNCSACGSIDFEEIARKIELDKNQRAIRRP